VQLHDTICGIMRRDIEFTVGEFTIGEFTVGERVLLSTKYLRLALSRDSSKYTAKLMPRYIGPYAVKSNAGKVSCRLALDTDMKVHPAFHVSLLKLYHGHGV
jgi:hypothetical protein